MKITVPDIKRMKEEGRKIPVLTAYDYTMAKILDNAGIPVLLVGDSAGMVCAGHENTLQVTVDEMIYLTMAVAKGRRRAIVVADMPFLSYQIIIEQAKMNAGRLVKEGGAEAVKLEGGENIKDTIKAIVDMGIPVMGHIGLLPQSVHKMGGYKVQGKGRVERKQLLRDAKAVESAGAFSIVLEGMPADLAKEITGSVSIPTIGIGAGRHCDGQVLVLYDMLGLYGDISPKFVKRYANLKEVITSAIRNYMEEVENGRFPEKGHSF
ncbi:MAG: 3-methyl-2-oxobutanoate hydroxymethyltransferase [Deltaproteobacteria bacterium GWC2_42_11]|nr:MAG: 3-methyl-2-oxobutanoate hydroxymethyltransferase [Deltaproteobacteria bacterium GWC2_42_11]HBO83523.1 3-methyl-2-oxobutanoate hydroxymethyltransferase [Deltaproteobacteria bacterium]